MFSVPLHSTVPRPGGAVRDYPLNMTINTNSTGFLAIIDIHVPAKKTCEKPGYILRYHFVLHDETNHFYTQETLSLVTPTPNGTIQIYGVFRNEILEVELKVICDRGYDQYSGTIATDLGSKSVVDGNINVDLPLSRIILIYRHLAV